MTTIHFASSTTHAKCNQFIFERTMSPISALLRSLSSTSRSALRSICTALPFTWFWPLRSDLCSVYMPCIDFANFVVWFRVVLPFCGQLCLINVNCFGIRPTFRHIVILLTYLLWPPCAADADTIFLIILQLWFLSFFMAALWYRAGHCIIALWCLSLFLYFPRLISAAADWMSTILPHMVWP